MANDNFKKWYIAGLHAVRSASEQGEAGARELQDKPQSADLKAVVLRYGKTAGEHQTRIAGFLDELGAEPNDFTDRIMEGVGNGTREMVKAAPDQDMIDMSVISGSQSGIQYYYVAFAGAAEQAKALGLSDQADGFEQMSDEWQAIGKQFREAAEPIMAKAAA